MGSKDKGGTYRTVHRSSVSGEFVKQRYAETHPNITEKERVRIPPPDDKGGDKSK